MNKPSLALAFIVKNEGKYAVDMINSVANIISHVCVVDTGSTDESITLIHDLLVKKNISHEIERIEFNNFSDARNKSIGMVPQNFEYLLILDCDEEIPSDQHEFLCGLMENNLYGYDGSFLPRINFRDNDAPLLYPDPQLRLLKNNGFLYSGDVHEMPQGGKWLMPSKDQFRDFPHINHYKYIRKSHIELEEREYQYQAVYRKNAFLRKKTVLDAVDCFNDLPIFEFEKHQSPSALNDYYDHPYFKEVVNYKSKLIANIGCKDEASVVYLATHLILNGNDSTVFAIDTWLGTSDGLIDAYCISDNEIDFVFGGSYPRFLKNIKNRGLIEWVLPFVMDPHLASIFFKNRRIYFDFIHLDFGRDYGSVITELNDWWPLLNSGGVLIGSNYYEDGIKFPDIKRAYDDFFEHVESIDGKCRVNKN